MVNGLRSPGFSAYDGNNGFDIIFSNGYRVAVLFSKKLLSEAAAYMNKDAEVIKNPPTADVKAFGPTGATIQLGGMDNWIRDVTPEMASEILYTIGKQPTGTPKEYVRSILVGYLKKA